MAIVPHVAAVGAEVGSVHLVDAVAVHGAEVHPALVVCNLGAIVVVAIATTVVVTEGRHEGVAVVGRR